MPLCTGPHFPCHCPSLHSHQLPASYKDLWARQGCGPALPSPLHVRDERGNCPETPEDGTWLTGTVPATLPCCGDVSGQAASQPLPAFSSPSHSELWLLRLTSCLAYLASSSLSSCPAHTFARTCSSDTGKPRWAAGDSETRPLSLSASQPPFLPQAGRLSCFAHSFSRKHEAQLC